MKNPKVTTKKLSNHTKWIKHISKIGLNTILTVSEDNKIKVWV